jgi:hypothetical protein
VIRAHLEHGRLVVDSRRSNVSGTPMSLLKLASLHSVESFWRRTDAIKSFVRGLSIRADDGDRWHIEIVAEFGGETRESLACVLNRDHCTRERGNGQPLTVHDNGCGVFTHYPP